MGKFDDYLTSLGTGDDGGVVYPETFQDDLRGAYAADFDGANAIIAQKDAEIASLTAKNTELAAANWTLLQSIPADGAIAGESNDNPADDNPDDEDPSTEDFFEDADKENS